MLEPLVPLAAQAAAVFLRRRETIAVADGATGGLIQAGLLTVPGATGFCRGGGVVYSLKGRDILLGLSRAELVGMESVTEAYALLQARAIRDRFGADWGIAESGSAGPGRHPRGAPTGRSCIAVAGPGPVPGTGPGIAVATTFESGSEDRIHNMGAFALAALRFLNSVLEDAARSDEG
jgi:nicotinamide-nucleotide amidase